MENSEDCKNVKVYFKIEYKDKDEIKKCKAKWDPLHKRWYIIHNHENNNAFGCFGDLQQIAKYDVYLDFIEHDYDDISEDKYDEIYLKYRKLLRQYRLLYLKNKKII